MRGRPGASQEIIRDSEFRKAGPEKELWPAEYLPVKRDVRHPFDFYWEILYRTGLRRQPSLLAGYFLARPENKLTQRCLKSQSTGSLEPFSPPVTTFLGNCRNSCIYIFLYINDTSVPFGTYSTNYFLILYIAKEGTSV